MKRCFVALTLPASTQCALAPVQQKIAQLAAGEGSVRLTRAENLHVTLKYLGPTATDLIPPLIDALRAVARRHVLEAVQVAGLGAFPTGRQPRAIFAAVAAGGGSAMNLGSEVDTLCAGLGLALGSRPRVLHVTLARVAGDQPALCRWLDEAESVSYGPLDSAAMTLYESTPAPQGSHYTPLATLPFGR